MHEQSETVGGLGRLWRNVYGEKTPQAGQPLPRQYQFEKDAYPTVKDAVEAAQYRSRLEMEEGQQQLPRFGLMELLRMLR